MDLRFFNLEFGFELVDYQLGVATYLHLFDIQAECQVEASSQGLIFCFVVYGLEIKLDGSFERRTLRVGQDYAHSFASKVARPINEQVPLPLIFFVCYGVHLFFGIEL